MSELSGRVALVTGASRGIGKAVALALADAGAAVAVNFRARRDAAEAVADAIRETGGRAAAFEADVSLRAAVERMVHDIEQHFGPIDILVNNAGSATPRGLDISEQGFDDTIAANLKPAFLCTQAVRPGMRARRWGRIINLSSIGARIGSGSVSTARIPIGRAGTGEEIAQVVLLLVRNEYITGQTIAVNGGSLSS